MMHPPSFTAIRLVLLGTLTGFVAHSSSSPVFFSFLVGSTGGRTFLWYLFGRQLFASSRAYFSNLETCYAAFRYFLILVTSDVTLSRRRAALPILVTLPIKAAANEGERQKKPKCSFQRLSWEFFPSFSHCREDAKLNSTIPYGNLSLRGLLFGGPPDKLHEAVYTMLVHISRLYNVVTRIA